MALRRPLGRKPIGPVRFKERSATYLVAELRSPEALIAWPERWRYTPKRERERE